MAQQLDSINTSKVAVIYCRVSDPKQVKEGDGLNSQEARCREFAERKGYEVVQVFRDNLTGKLTDRPGMTKMLDFLTAHKDTQQHIVIIDDINRLARGVIAHWELRTSISEAGGKLESPSIEFGEDSDSVLIENLLASVSQHQREKNREQVVNRMRGRTLNGYWCFHAPIGYKYKQMDGQGKIMVRDEPFASIVQEALEGFASGRFSSQSEVTRFLESQPEFPKDLPNGKIRVWKITRMLTSPLYAGYIELEKWNIPLRQGKHEGLITLETYQKIQKLIKDGAKAPARKDISADFPLRGFVLCGDCGHQLTAAWSKGEYRHYAYYLCQKKGCASYGKSIRKAKIEGEFEALLGTMKPTKPVFQSTVMMLRDMWDHRIAKAVAFAKSFKKKIAALEKQITQFLDRIVESTNPTVIKTYEKRITELEKEKLLIEEKARSKGQPRNTFEDIIELSLTFLSNPCRLWHSERLDLQRTVLKLAFSERLTYQRGEGYRTPDLSKPFKLLKQIQEGKNNMVRVGRIELPLPKERDFESRASTNSATPAHIR